jgi:hypothetical protein
MYISYKGDAMKFAFSVDYQGGWHNATCKMHNYMYLVVAHI